MATRRELASISRASSDGGLVLLGSLVAHLSPLWVALLAATVLLVSLIARRKAGEHEDAEEAKKARDAEAEALVKSASEFRKHALAFGDSFRTRSINWEPTCRKIGWPARLADGPLKEWKQRVPFEGLSPDEKDAILTARDCYARAWGPGNAFGSALHIARGHMTEILNEWVDANGKPREGVESLLRTYRSMLVMHAYVEIACAEALDAEYPGAPGAWARLGDTSSELHGPTLAPKLPSA